jgi:hypothetical protein
VSRFAQFLTRTRRIAVHRRAIRAGNRFKDSAETRIFEKKCNKQ